jgi:hypothetical protein
MADIKDEAWKFVGSIVPMLGAGVQLWTGLVKDLRQSNYVEKVIGPLGKAYDWIWRRPLVLANWLLILIIGLALLALFGGVNKIMSWCESPFCRMCVWVFDRSIWLVLFYFILAVMVYLQILPRILHLFTLLLARFHPGLKYNPGLINVDWLLQRGEQARLININETQCEIVASFLFRLPGEEARSDYAGKGWSSPCWPEASRANALLIGCVIEGVIHDLPRSAPAKKDLDVLYEAIFKLGPQTWEPKSIISHTAEHILEALPRTHSHSASEVHEPGLCEKFIHALIPSGHEELNRRGSLKSLASEQAIIQAVTHTLRLLSSNYGGDASKLAHRRWRQPSLPRARQNLQAFPTMNSARANAMDVQFLKLAISEHVWPTIKLDNFVYPFSRGVAMLMMNTGCLMPTPDTREVVMDELFRRLLASAEQAVVNAVALVLRRDANLAQKLGISDANDPWEIGREVDYLLWWLSRRPRGWELNVEALNGAAVPDDNSESSPWKLVGNALVHT